MATGKIRLGDPWLRLKGIINSPEDAAKAVRMHYKRGDDLIKIMPSGGVLDQSSKAVAITLR